MPLNKKTKGDTFNKWKDPSGTRESEGKQEEKPIEPDVIEVTNFKPGHPSICETSENSDNENANGRGGVRKRGRKLLLISLMKMVQ